MSPSILVYEDKRTNIQRENGACKATLYREEVGAVRGARTRAGAQPEEQHRNLGVGG